MSENNITQEHAGNEFAREFIRLYRQLSRWDRFIIWLKIKLLIFQNGICPSRPTEPGNSQTEQIPPLVMPLYNRLCRIQKRDQEKSFKVSDNTLQNIERK